jgi:hypothetical protein
MHLFSVSRKTLILLSTLVILLSIPITTYLVQQRQDIRKKAETLAEEQIEYHPIAHDTVGAYARSQDVPNGIYDPLSNKTFIVYSSGNASGGHSETSPYIIAYNHNTGNWSQEVKITTNPSQSNGNGDAHYYPQVVVDDNGYIHVLFTFHNDHNTMHAKSTSPGKISNWNVKYISNSRATYGRAFKSTNGDLYLFYRRTLIDNPPDWHEPQVYIKSTDNGNSWSSPQNIIDPEHDEDYWNTINLAAAKYQSSPEGIHMVFINGYNHAEYVHKIFYTFFSFSNKHLYSASGKDFGTTLTRSEFEFGRGDFQAFNSFLHPNGNIKQQVIRNNHIFHRDIEKNTSTGKYTNLNPWEEISLESSIYTDTGNGDFQAFNAYVDPNNSNRIIQIAIRNNSNTSGRGRIYTRTIDGNVIGKWSTLSESDTIYTQTGSGKFQGYNAFENPQASGRLVEQVMRNNTIYSRITEPGQNPGSWSQIPSSSDIYSVGSGDFQAFNAFFHPDNNNIRQVLIRNNIVYSRDIEFDASGNPVLNPFTPIGNSSTIYTRTGIGCCEVYRYPYPISKYGTQDPIVHNNDKGFPFIYYNYHDLSQTDRNKAELRITKWTGNSWSTKTISSIGTIVRPHEVDYRSPNNIYLYLRKWDKSRNHPSYIYHFNGSSWQQIHQFTGLENGNGVGFLTFNTNYHPDLKGVFFNTIPPAPYWGSPKSNGILYALASLVPTVTLSPTNTPMPTNTPTPPLCSYPNPSISASCNSNYKNDLICSWSGVNGATVYRGQIDNNSDFSSPLVNTTGSGTSRSIGNVTAGQTYYCRVKVTQSNGTCTAPSSWSTKVNVKKACPTPTLPPTNTPIPSATNTSIPDVPGDGNGDGVVDIDDYVIWLNNYQEVLGGNNNGDYYPDDYIDGLDFIIWLNNYGT